MGEGGEERRGRGEEGVEERRGREEEGERRQGGEGKSEREMREIFL